jgi:hypothetical protein
MYTTVVLLLFLAFLLLYNTSKKSKWPDKPAWANYLEYHKPLSAAIAGLLVIISAVILIVLSGSVSGIFSLIVILMAMGSLTVLVFPFRYLSVNHVVLLFVVFIAFEQLIF